MANFINKSIIFRSGKSDLLQTFQLTPMLQLKGQFIDGGLEQKHDEEKDLSTVKKKKLTLKKKPPNFHPKIYSNVDLKFVANIGNICFLTEDALRNPDSSHESVLKSAYHYNTISKITLNDSFVCMDFKKHNQNFLPPEYFIERLRSFGDKQMAGMADHLEKIHQQFSMIKEGNPTNDTPFCKENEQLMLRNFIQSRENKKFFLYFSEITPQRTSIKNVIFSRQLLDVIGCDVDTLQTDFMKYKNAFFDVFTAKNYGNVMEQCFQKFGKIQASLMINPELSMDERINLTEFTYFDDIVIQKSGIKGEHQEILPAKCLWFSPHPSICYFEVLDIMKSETPFQSTKKRLNQDDLKLPAEDIRQELKIGHSKTDSTEGQLDSYIDEFRKGVCLDTQVRDGDQRKLQSSIQKNSFVKD